MNRKEQIQIAIDNVRSAQDLLTKAWKSIGNEIVRDSIKEVEIELIDLRIYLEAQLRTNI